MFQFVQAWDQRRLVLLIVFDAGLLSSELDILSILLGFFICLPSLIFPFSLRNFVLGNGEERRSPIVRYRFFILPVSASISQIVIYSNPGILSCFAAKCIRIVPHRKNKNEWITL